MSSAASLTVPMASMRVAFSPIRLFKRSACSDRRSPATRPSESRSRAWAARNSRARLSSLLIVVSRSSSRADSSASAVAVWPNRAASRVLLRIAISHRQASRTRGRAQSLIQPIQSSGLAGASMTVRLAQTKNPVQPNASPIASVAAIKLRELCCWRDGSSTHQSSLTGAAAASVSAGSGAAINSPSVLSIGVICGFPAMVNDTTLVAAINPRLTHCR